MISGQGMNAGFEDCTILTELFNSHGSNLELILSEFSKKRWQDAHAISDLAMYNYVEMRDLVNKRCKLTQRVCQTRRAYESLRFKRFSLLILRYTETFCRNSSLKDSMFILIVLISHESLIISAYLLRKTFDDFLFWLMPHFWVPLYNSVSFTHMPYKQCTENRAWQDRVLNKMLTLGGFIGACVAALGVYTMARNAKLGMINYDLMMSFIKNPF